MSAHEVLRPEGGPLERSHLKDMVQRNTMETVALTKISKHLETERKAFVRQSTRDEEEMKHLLQRLQFRQQTTLLEDSCISDEDALECKEEDGDDVNIVVNPYPITIVPKFGASGNSTKPISSSTKLGNHGKQTRTKSGEYEEVIDSMSLMTTSSASVSDQYALDDITSQWLASPNAISSVRRLRKTIPEQIQRKIMIRANSDMNWGIDFPAPPSSPNSHSRSNSLKERKKSSGVTDDLHSQRPSGIDGRRGGSLKERKHSHVMDESGEKGLWRSYSMIASSSLYDGNTKTDVRHFRRLSDRKRSTSETGNDVNTNVVVNNDKQNEQNRPILRKNSKKTDKTSAVKKNK